VKVASRNLYKALIESIRSTDERVARLLEDFLSKRKPTRRERMTRAAEIQAVLKALDASVPKEARRVVEIAYDQTRRAVQREPKVDLFPEVSNFSVVHREAVNLLTDNIVNTLGEATTTLGRRTEDALRRHGLKTATEQLIREQPERLARDRFVNRLRADGLTAFVDKAGRRWSLTNYADMALKTTIAEAQSQATVNVLFSRGLDLVMVEHPNEHHKDDECTQWEGGPWSLTGKTPGYPVLGHLPPFHPRCDHFIRPAREGLSALAERKAA
jgi:hypothetical protein